jgi:uncharacterized membrane-anchored protein
MPEFARLRVPQITALFWLIKGLSTALGESTSDYLVVAWQPVPAVMAGFLAFAIAMIIQLTRRRYRPVSYWLAVVMVGVFGTMVADVIHVGFGVPYAVSAPAFAIVLALVFVIWWRTEGTLSIHSIATSRRELFYWMAVIGTFALGTALGDLTSVALGIGYLGSVVLFAAVMLIPALGFRFGRGNAIACFWFAYVLTRPLGASVADWLGKPQSAGGLGWGSGWVALGLTAAIVIGVVVELVAARGVFGVLIAARLGGAGLGGAGVRGAGAGGGDVGGDPLTEVFEEDVRDAERQHGRDDSRDQPRRVQADRRGEGVEQREQHDEDSDSQSRVQNPGAHGRQSKRHHGEPI